MLDWLIIGGGIHGRYIARALNHTAPGARLAIVDRRAGLASWQRRADACGMDFLRSSIAHHVGHAGDTLRAFAATNGYDAQHTLGVYRRPSRDLFEAHSAAQPDRAPTINANVLAVERHAGVWRVALDNGDAVTARRVILATGPGRPHRPNALASAEHVFDHDFELHRHSACRVTIVGGGISGAQLALRAHAHGLDVTWITRTPPRRADFDSDPCYAGPKCLAPFSRGTVDERRARLAIARQPGTLPPDVYARMAAALASGGITWRAGEPNGLSSGGVELNDGRRVSADRVILATGFDTRPAAESVLGRLVRALDIAVDADGHVDMADTLDVAPGVHVVGRPASLRLGPMAGNIKGARQAAARLADLAAREAAGAARLS